MPQSTENDVLDAEHQSKDEDAGAFRFVVNLQLQELGSRLASEHRRVVAGLEAKVIVLEADNSRLQRKVSQLLGDLPAEERRLSPKVFPENDNGRATWTALQNEMAVAVDQERRAPNSLASSYPNDTRSSWVEEPNAHWCASPFSISPVPQEGVTPMRVEDLRSEGQSDRGHDRSSSSCGPCASRAAQSSDQSKQADVPAKNSRYQRNESNECNDEVTTKATASYGLRSSKFRQEDSQDGYFSALGIWEGVSNVSRLATDMVPAHFLEQGELPDSPRAWDRKVQRFMLHPSSRFALMWELLAVILIIVDMLVIPFQTFHVGNGGQTWLIVAWITRLFWSFDIGMSFLTGTVSSQGIREMRPSAVAKQYATSRFPFDLFVVVCDWTEVAAGGAASGWSLIGMLRALRMIRILRLMKSKKITEFVFFRIRSEWAILVTLVVLALFVLLMLIHVIACIWFAIRAKNIQAERNTYLMAFHTVLALFLGEHVTNSRSDGERIFTVIVLFFAFTSSVLIVGAITTAMTRLLFLGSQHSAQFALLNNYLSDHQISPELQLRVQRNAQHSLNEQKRNTPESSVKLLRIVSDQLRAELHYEVHSRILTAHPFFDCYNRVNPICIRLICHNAIDIVSLSQDDVLFSEFEVPVKPKMFIVQSGALQYSTSFGICRKVHPKQWISEAALWTHWVHRGTLKVKTESRILALDSKQFGELVSMYRTREGYAYKYAQKFLEDLNDTELCVMTDIGNDLKAQERVERVFSHDELQSRPISTVRARVSSLVSSFGIPGRGSSSTPDRVSTNRHRDQRVSPSE